PELRHRPDVVEPQPLSEPPVARLAPASARKGAIRAPGQQRAGSALSPQPATLRAAGIGRKYAQTVTLVTDSTRCNTTRHARDDKLYRAPSGILRRGLSGSPVGGSGARS